MYQIASLILVASFIFTLVATCFLSFTVVTQREKHTEQTWAQTANIGITGLITVTCCILLYAFIANEFQVKYVQDYSSTSLAFFYRLTAFWAGQPGSLLFWAWTVALSGILFPFTKVYKKFTPTTLSWYWCFFFAIMAFFLFILVTWNNPFELVKNVRPDGYGMNPLLQNPGMIFHPPLLFLGYGGFVVPGCLALAQAMKAASNVAGEEPRWAVAGRVFILVAWAMLTAGIILGAWWAYMELGWGGYWAWDPVENASLLPWLIATAYLHTGIIESQRNKLHRTNIFLMVLTTISAFFATYLVRSGVIQSLHAFGSGGLGAPFLVFIFMFLLVAIVVCYKTPVTSTPLDSLFSREGSILMVAWIMIALSFIILIATMWPVIIEGAIALKGIFPSLATIVPSKAMGLEPAFYNKTCLPFFAILGILLMLCPHLLWSKGFVDKRIVVMISIGAIGLCVGLWFSGMQNILALFATTTSFAAIVGIVLLFANKPQLFKSPNAIISHGTHIGLLLIIIGVAFSGPYQSKNELALRIGESTTVGKYTLTLNEIYHGNSDISASGEPYFRFQELEILVTKNNQFFGVLAPQMRQYAGYEDRYYPDVSTVFGLGDELYATFTSFDPNQGRARLDFNVNPLVNWLWIGGVLMSIFPLYCLRRKKTSR